MIFQTVGFLLMMAYLILIFFLTQNFILSMKLGIEIVFVHSMNAPSIEIVSAAGDNGCQMLEMGNKLMLN